MMTGQMDSVKGRIENAAWIAAYVTQWFTEAQTFKAHGPERMWETAQMIAEILDTYREGIDHHDVPTTDCADHLISQVTIIGIDALTRDGLVDALLAFLGRGGA